MGSRTALPRYKAQVLHSICASSRTIHLLFLLLCSHNTAELHGSRFYAPAIWTGHCKASLSHVLHTQNQPVDNSESRGRGRLQTTHPSQWVSTALGDLSCGCLLEQPLCGLGSPHHGSCFWGWITPKKRTRQKLYAFLINQLFYNKRFIFKLLLK